MTDSDGTILIAEDDPMIVDILRAILEEDYAIHATGEPTALLALAAAEKPDIVLLDIRMPGIDGFELCRRLKSEPDTQDIPVIFVTAMNNSDDETTGLECGAIDYITKPFNPAVVKARVKNHMELKKYRDMLANLSSLDGLTGIANRRCFDEHLDREWRRAARLSGPLSLVMMDIDFFKRYNDANGHLAGDECLKRVAQALAGNAQRPTDLIARYGGEEFAAILPETPLEGAVKMAEDCRADVEALAIPHSDSATSEVVTLSLGVASIIALAGASPDILIEAADRMLYKAKGAGRNRVVAEP